MATASVHSLPLSSAPPPSPPRKRLSKVLTAGRRRSSDVQSETANAGLRGSIESLGLARSPTIPSQRSPSRGGSTRSSASNSVKKLIPGNAKRERKKVREDELLKIAAEEAARGRQPAEQAPFTEGSLRRPDNLSRSHSSLLTVDSELESPPALTSRDSHSGYLTTTSPLIKTSPIDRSDNNSTSDGSVEKFPTIVERPQAMSVPTSPKSPALRNIPSLPPLPGLQDRADTLKPGIDPSRARGKSPARRFKDVFSKSGKSPRVSPERSNTDLASAFRGSELDRPGSSFGERRLSNNPEARGPSPLRSQIGNTTPAPKSAAPTLQTDIPKTPPASVLRQPTTTVTPPTPTDPESRASLQAVSKPDYTGNEWSEPTQGSPQNAGHRRTRSGPGMLHQKTKLSTSMVAPLTPTIEETRTPTGSVVTPPTRNVSAGGGFFSSMVSAAQNAATSITNLTNQNRARAGTGSSDPSRPKSLESLVKEETQEKKSEDAAAPSKELAISTIGSGDLNLGHLGIDASSDKRTPSPSRSDYESSVKEDVAVKIEDMLAKRAVSQAYERPGRSGNATPVAEIPDPVTSVKSASTFDTKTTGTITPPNGSIFEGETSGVKRTNSVRSKLHNRHSRGSSVTTAQSTLGAMIGASTATLANPATGPKLSGFALAPKPRNRAFHQQFRSVPEDDFLVEDYSSALQKEILLAGRLYISEGHICFSSNILGWVTTLIISFEEVVSIEKENTAIVIPNAIAVQTLHARHTFRSLLSREATYDLMIGIWRVSHPDSFQKSMNGQKLAAGTKSTENVTDGEEPEAPVSADEDSGGSGSEDDDSSVASIGSSDSMAGDDYVEAKSSGRKPSGAPVNGTGPSIAASAAPAAGDATAAVLPVVTAVDGAQDYPGPAAHAPTECSDSATHFDKIIKDEIIQAPLGKIYSLLYGAQSTTFLRKFLLEGVSKAQDLQLEDDKKGLDNETKSRKYQYVKPLGGSIGPKQTTCITTESLDSFDLEKAVSVTCTTQTPDVPSGSAFTTKTRYCLTWAPGNATRFQMNMTVDWTAKSWLKGPIEKGALDGQQQYSDDLVKTLKGALGRSRATTAGSKVLKNGAKKKKRSSKRDKSDTAQTTSKKEENWGALEVLRPVLGPLVDLVRPIVSMNLVVTILTFLVLWMWFRGPATSSAALSRAAQSQRLVHYDDLWQREESDLWAWLEDRAGVDGVVVRDSLQNHADTGKQDEQRSKHRQTLLRSKDIQSRLREEKASMKEMEEAVRLTQERLETLQKALERQKNHQEA